MFFTGISDEAGSDIATQIKAHRELGWKHLELRLVDGVNVCALSDEAFGRVRSSLEEAGLGVSCFASAIANWSRPISSDFQLDLDDLNRAIPRMQALGTPFIRVMSYPNDPENPYDEVQWRVQAIARIKVLAKIAEDGGVTLVHENCSGWGGLSADNGNILLDEVDSPALKAVFDTGNPVTYRQDAWESYMSLEKDIVYVHIKDAKRINDNDVYTYCGEGDGCVAEIVADLLARGYDGGLSIEPHLAAVIHTGQEAGSAQRLYDSYTEYGRRLMKIVERARPRQEEGPPPGRV